MRLLTERLCFQVQLAQILSAKLAENPSERSDRDKEASSIVKKSLASLGMTSPAVTEELAQDEAEYHISLAKELGLVLLGSRERVYSR